MTASRRTPRATATAVRRVGLIVRVSTDLQANKEEGSLKTQLQRLRAHLAYKRDACGEDWTEMAVYELRAVSGKDSARSKEFARLYADIESGKVNAVMACALDRVMRSVKDFLAVFEFLHEHEVEFVSLKEQCDTSTPVGRLFATIIMALAQFERENTAERTRDAHRARADRGLWNGGQLLGYDLDPDRKGSLVPNPDEAATVNFAFDSYLKLGSLKETAEALNQRGYRTKTYTSRRKQVHPGTAFTLTSVQYLLKNPAYIAKKEVEDQDGNRRLVDAVWPAIVESATFDEVQRLMAVNGQSRHNGAQTVRHVHVLGGLLVCGRCGGVLEGRSGTGSKGKVYFYYACKEKTCGMRVAAEEVEQAVIDQIGVMAQEQGLLERLVAETNERVLKQLPELQKQERALRRQLEQVNAEAGKVLGQWSALDGSEAQVFLREQLDGLAQRRTELDHGLEEVGAALRQAEDKRVTAAAVRAALTQVRAVYDHLRPFEQKELLRLVLRKAVVGDREIVLEVNGNACRGAGQAEEDRFSCSQRFGTPEWLPEQDSNLQQAG